jgi:tagatose-1,6-bisphosphate aldolase
MSNHFKTVNYVISQTYQLCEELVHLYKIPFPLYGSGCRQARIFAANKSALSHDFKFIVVF